MIDHVQIACPPGSEEVLRGYYRDLLGLTEKPKPPRLAVRGGCWFTGHGIELHLGVEEDFRPARKAHPGLLWPDLDGLAARLAVAGYEVTWADPAELDEWSREPTDATATDGDPRATERGNHHVRRFHAHDPYGNRLEFLTKDPQDHRKS